ncbi:unnamed protein product [Adineta ricciae]|uniref:NHL repeat containing protein n=1 Tax=Adineta ricciae TaxID=249248 RepID=A0A815C786_ADIRI|nr:unnamed protein product [Adineta ricciae]CAF1279796.1 unnamed protein product [Adineta ricciae]
MTKTDKNTDNVQLSDIASSSPSETTTTKSQVQRDTRKYIIICVIAIIVIIAVVVITVAVLLTKQKAKPIIPIVEVNGNTTWKQHGITVAGGNKSGNELNKLNGPRGFDLDDDLTLYIADEMNHRVVRWKVNASQGELIAGKDGKGNKRNQLETPTDVAIDKQNHSLIICDAGNSRILKVNHHNLVQEPTVILNTDCFSIMIDNNGYIYISETLSGGIKRWKEGQSDPEVIAGGNGPGNDLYHHMFPMYFFVDHNNDLVYVSDAYNHRVMKWLKNATKGIVVAGGYNNTNDLVYLLNVTTGIVVDNSNNIYVADRDNSRIMRFTEGSQVGKIVVSGKSVGSMVNQLKDPEDILFDREGNLYVVDCGNHRVQKFFIDKRH